MNIVAAVQNILWNKLKHLNNLVYILQLYDLRYLYQLVQNNTVQINTLYLKTVTSDPVW